MYKLSHLSDSIIIRLTDGANISVIPGNPDYEEYVTWLVKGNIPEPADMIPIKELKSIRNSLLAETDIPWGLADYQHPNKQAWLDYRQALRDLPSTADPQLDENGDLTNVTWPEPPVT